MKEVFHCSPDDITTFDFSNGVHFGGYFSALQAGNRKLGRVNSKYDINQDYLYIYSFFFKETICYQTEDVGGYDAWMVEIEKAKAEGFNVIKYINKYEPDNNSYSYIILDSSLLTLNYKIKITEKEVDLLLLKHEGQNVRFF